MFAYTKVLLYCDSHSNLPSPLEMIYYVKEECVCGVHVPEIILVGNF
eukprot:SAG31_NODE_878_length_11297_cov_3.770714_2_plen_47_part_00